MKIRNSCFALRFINDKTDLQLKMGNSNVTTINIYICYESIVYVTSTEYRINMSQVQSIE